MRRSYRPTKKTGQNLAYIRTATWTSCAWETHCCVQALRDMYPYFLPILMYTLISKHMHRSWPYGIRGGEWGKELPVEQTPRDDTTPTDMLSSYTMYTRLLWLPFAILLIVFGVEKVKTQAIICSPILHYDNSSFCGKLVWNIITPLAIAMLIFNLKGTTQNVHVCNFSGILGCKCIHRRWLSASFGMYNHEHTYIKYILYHTCNSQHYHTIYYSFTLILHRDVDLFNNHQFMS